MNEIIENCQLEWHKERGVLYVHNKDTGATVLRICGLTPQKGMLTDGLIDISIPQYHSYAQDSLLTRVGISYPPTK